MLGSTTVPGFQRLSLLVALCLASACTSSRHVASPAAHANHGLGDAEHVQIDADGAPSSVAPEGSLATGSVTASAPVVVAIVVDQLSAWQAQERWPLLPPGGFSRLLAQGTWVKNLHYLHAISETAPGHASLFTGEVPRDHGVAANLLFRREVGREVSPLFDTREDLIGPSVREPGNGISLSVLNAPTLADRLLEKHPGAVAVALSIKDRGAAFGAGRKSAATLWYESKSGTLVTSSAYASDVPLWALPLAYPRDRYRTRVWELLDRDFVVRHAEVVDDSAGEEALFGDRKFPHAFIDPQKLGAHLRFTPFLDEWLVDLGLAATDALRPKNEPFLLVLSFSSHDYVGHAFGPDSWESWDVLLRLNRQLERLFSEFDVRFGVDGYSVILSADHGIGTMPERLTGARLPKWCQAGQRNSFEKPCTGGTRIVAADVVRRVKAVMMQRGWSADLAHIELSQGFLQVHPLVHALPEVAAAKFAADLARSVLSQPGIAAMEGVDALRAACQSDLDESAAALLCRSLPPRVADYLVTTNPGSFFSTSSEHGLAHGCLARHDRLVPLLVHYAGQVEPRTVEDAFFGSFYASLWLALTGEAVEGRFGGPVAGFASLSRR
jgi:hypothetical protein